MRKVGLGLALSLLAAACTPEKPNAVATDAGAAPPAPSIDEATLKSMSHAFFDAYDRSDDATVSSTLGPTFVQFEDGHVFERELLVRRLRASKARNAPAQSRTWANEKAIASGDSAVFIAESTEHFPAVQDHAAFEVVYWNTLVWARTVEGWKVAHWQGQKGGTAAQREMWNDAYRGVSPAFSTKPNALLVETLKGRKPGAALDIATGQGRNAIYLASQGWKVTGVDIADEGLRVTALAASKQNLKLELVNADIEKWDMGSARWDLVTMIYAGTDKTTIEHAKTGLRQGGLFIVEYFGGTTDEQAEAGGFAPGELRSLFGDGFTILRDEIVVGVADWGLHETKLARFVAQKLR